MHFSSLQFNNMIPQLAGSFLVGSIILGFVFLILIKIFYLITLSKALACCSPQSRTSSPGMVWLELVPVLGTVWAFVNVVQVSVSIGNEFRHRGIVSDESPSIVLGIVACSLGVATPVIPFVGIAGLICWVVYWMKISDYSRILMAVDRDSQCYRTE